MPPIIQKLHKTPNDRPDMFIHSETALWRNTVLFFLKNIDFCNQQMTQTCVSLFPAGPYFFSNISMKDFLRNTENDAATQLDKKCLRGHSLKQTRPVSFCSWTPPSRFIMMRRVPHVWNGATTFISCCGDISWLSSIVINGANFRRRQ